MNESTKPPFSLPSRGSLQATMEILVACSLMVLGACGNALVFIAFWKDKSLRTTPNVFVVNLAVTDFLFCVVVLPLTSATFIQGEWKLGLHVCNLQALMFGTNLNATLVTMTTISINRFILIRHRIKYKTVYTKRNVTFMIFGIWCYAIIVASRPFYDLGKYVFNPNTAFCSIDKKPDSASRISRFVAYFTLYANIIIVMRCYVGIYRAVRQHRRQIKCNTGHNPENTTGNTTGHNTGHRTGHRTGHSSQNRGLRKVQVVGEDVHIAKTLFVVICLFGICWFPTAIAGIVVVFGTKIPGLVQEMLMFTVCLASVVNPLVYAVRNRRFRRTFKRIIELQFSTVADRPALRISVRPEHVQTTL